MSKLVIVLENSLSIKSAIRLGLHLSLIHHCVIGTQCYLQMLCASFEDEPRFRAMIEEWVAREEVPSFPAFAGECEQKRKARKRKGKAEAKEAEKALEEMGATTSEQYSIRIYSYPFCNYIHNMTISI